MCDPSLARTARCHRHWPREPAEGKRPEGQEAEACCGDAEMPVGSIRDSSESFGSLNIGGRLVRAVPGARGVRPRKVDPNEAR